MENISIIGKYCCGCRVCGQLCPTGAIAFIEDGEGFFNPYVKQADCINCGKCLKACPSHSVNVFQEEQKGYAAKTTEIKDLERSSSGGVFSAMAKYTLSAGGVVCGCTADEHLLPKHIVASTWEEVEGMRGSKYVQSDMGSIYTHVQEALRRDVMVLFTGVPCQVAALRNFLGRDYPNLYCVDIICHGVPSRKLYASWLDWMGDKWNGKVTNVEFRSKKRHQWSLTLGVTIRNRKGKEKEHLLMGSLDPYYYNFLQGNTYRESCYHCKYAQEKRPGDITIGDFWGVEQTHPELFDIRGLSCVLVNSPQGDRLWDKLSTQLLATEVETSAIINYNGNLRQPTKRPPIRDVVYKELNEKGFKAIPYNLPRAFRIVDRIKNIVPNRYRYAVKNVLRKV